MNSTLLKESDLEINAYLNSLSLHQSFEEDDSDDDEYLAVNPSGSVLQPACNPYNKQKKIAEANETLFAEEVAPKSPKRVKFNKVEKRICYDYFGSSFESDSIKSYEDEESEKESLLQNIKQTIEPNLDIKGNHLQPQPQNPASKVIVTVSPRKEEGQHHSESESEDVCIGTVEKTDESNENKKRGDDTKEETPNTHPNIKIHQSVHTNVSLKNTCIDDSLPLNSKKKTKENKKEKIGKENEKKEKDTVHVARQEIEENNIAITSHVDGVHVHPSNCKNANNANVEKNNKVVLLDSGVGDMKRSSSPSKDVDFYPCLANHSGITIRITGADSLESVESESTDNEVQMLDNFNYHNINHNINQDSSFPVPKGKNNSIKINETTLVLSNQTFILKGTKSNQNVRSQKPKKYETGPTQKSNSKKGEKMLNGPNPNETEKTEPPSPKVEKYTSKRKTNSKRAKSKSLEEGMNETTDDCLSCNKKVRPKSSVERGSVKVKTGPRPKTAPVIRSCCQWGNPHLPEYNGLRSEYGLSAEQLIERKRQKMEALKIQKQKKEQKNMDELQKRKENEATFIAWLENKRKQAQEQYLRNQKLQAESGIKIYPAPTAHLKKTKAVRNRKLFRPERKCISLEELLNSASSHEKKTYRIYLGLSFDD